MPSDWVLVSTATPIPFDLVLIKDENGCTQPAWWTGKVWDFGKKHIRGKVVMWTRKGVDNYDLFAIY